MLLKNRILIGTFLALGTLAAGFWVTTQNFQARQSLEMHKSRLAMSQLFLEFVIGNENRSMAAQMKSVMRDRETIDAIEKNETASVAPRVVTTFRRLKTSAILDELHVSNSRGEVMLAFPEGSDSSGAASLANKALERSKPVYGVALNNRRQLQLLVSFPVYKAGRPVGTISYAKDFGAIAQLIKQHGFAGVLVTDTDHRPVYQTDAGLFEQFEPLVLATAGESGRKLATDKRYFEAFTLPIHNSDGKLIAKFVEVADTTDASAAQLQAFWMTQGILAGLIVLSLAAMSIWLHMQFKPLGRFLQALGEVSRGNLEASFDGHENRDEIGAIVRTFRDFRAGLIDKQRQHERERQLAEDQQRADRKRLAEAFDQEVGAIVAHVSDSSSALSRTAETLSRTSSLASEEVQSATKASRQTSNSVQAVASAAEQMAMTIEEISGQVQQASGASRQAVEEALRANSQMQALQHTSDRISEITGLISAIADQTNLLALNATIEAARAGAAGRGFAVVASEVKSLANQSAKATNDIARQIGDIQNASLEATRSMESVNAAIERVEAISSAIAGAIEQQSAATREIAQSVDIVASSTADVDRSINGVAQRSTEVGSASHTVSTSSQAMLRQTDQLKEAVSRFLRQVKTG